MPARSRSNTTIIQTKLHTMKNKIALASAFVAASSLATAEIVINDFLSFEGFVDSSYQYSDLSGDTDDSFGVDQVEINWLFDFDTVTAQIDFAYIGSDAAGTAVADDDADVVVEQAFVTYDLGDGSAITAGRMASMLGFEAFEPTGLYQFSFAYDNSILPGYSEGVKFTNETENAFYAVSILSGYSDEDAYAGRLGGPGDSNYAIELAASFVFGENGEYTWFIGGLYEDAENDTTPGLDGANTVLNTYVTYETGAWIFAAEANLGNSEVGAFDVISNDDDVDALSGLLMANYAYSEQASVTGRLSYEEFDGTNADAEQVKLTAAHSYAFTDNLSLITEVSFIDREDENGDSSDGLAAAVELLFAF